MTLTYMIPTNFQNLRLYHCSLISYNYTENRIHFTEFKKSRGNIGVYRKRELQTRFLENSKITESCIWDGTCKKLTYKNCVKPDLLNFPNFHTVNNGGHFQQQNAVFRRFFYKNIALYFRNFEPKL